MRGIFGILSLLVTLAIVGVVVKKQLATTPLAAPVLPGATIEAAPILAPNQSPQQTQQQFKQALDAAMQPVQRSGDEK